MKRFLVCVVLSYFLYGSLGWAKNDWQEYKTDHFKIYSHQVDNDFINTVMSEAEDTFLRVLGGLGLKKSQAWNRENPVSIYIYTNSQDYVNNGGQAGWSHGAALIQTRSIRTYPSASGFFDSILPHELAHIMFHEYIGINTPVPLWFDEGVAMYQEKAKQLGGHKASLEALKNGEFIPLIELTNMRLYSQTEAKRVGLFYAESASIVNFMIAQLGDFHFYKLCRELKDGRDFEQALQSGYPRLKNLQELNKQWLLFLKNYE